MNIRLNRIQKTRHGVIHLAHINETDHTTNLLNRSQGRFIFNQRNVESVCEHVNRQSEEMDSAVNINWVLVSRFKIVGFSNHYHEIFDVNIFDEELAY